MAAGIEHDGGEIGVIVTAKKEPNTSEQFLSALKKYWGYDAFRPRQEEVVRSLAAGRDVCVIMPTGGGKSLCYQLPALLDERRTAVVISPLIALMQDQVAHLRQMGIPAVFLNSAVVGADRQDVKQRATAGEYRLIYVSPERAVMEGTAEWLKKIDVSFFAIDEAHCISEWGHDFRPEYRQLNNLRRLFPDRPIAAFTASATRQVRHDIVELLGLRDPLKSVSSFRRENLRYVVKKCEKGMQSNYLLQAVRESEDGSTIVYVPTVKRVAEVVDSLKENGLQAIGYHGQMEAGERQRNQEAWSSEKVPIIVGTIAFGLGINKPNVRAVIHLALPKSIEHYYQESGRAGRDGEQAVCILLWRGSDLGLLVHFIDEAPDSFTREKGWQQYRSIEKYATGKQCRQRTLCEHFGEKTKWDKCGQCDSCAGEYAWDAASRVQKRHPDSVAARETMRLLQAGKSLEQIARVRRVQVSSVCDMAGKLVEYGCVEYSPVWMDEDKQEMIEQACKKAGLRRLKPIKELLPEDIGYGEIRLVVARLRRLASGPVTNMA
jgi:ATP-dependent DNA helicase RecQ